MELEERSDRLCLWISTANSGINQEICRQQRPEVQHSPELRLTLYSKWSKMHSLSLNMLRFRPLCYLQWRYKSAFNRQAALNHFWELLGMRGEFRCCN